MVGSVDIDPVLIALFGGLAILLAGVVLLCLVRLISAPREIVGDEPELVVLVVLGWALLISGVGAGVLFLCLVLLGPVFAFIVVVGGFVVLLMAYFQHRQARQYALLSAMAVGAERLMPLAPAVDAFAEESWGVMGRRARRLAALLRAGMSLADALYRTPGLIPRQAQVTIRVGQESGLLAAALRDVVRSHDVHAPVWHQIMGRTLYLCGVIVFACGFVVPFMMIKIIPEFRKIFEEFDAELPGITQIVIGVANTFFHFWFLLGPVLFILFTVLLIQFVSGARWNVPLVNWLTRRLDTAAVLEALALSAERNLAFAAAIDTLARWYPKGWIRRRLRGVLGDLKAGIDWSQSLARRGLIREVELAVFLAAGRAGNLAWALREMAESNRRRLYYRLYMAAQVLFPMAILALGLLVMIYVVSCFLPLISLIQNLT
jgi:protein transport protein HofC